MHRRQPVRLDEQRRTAALVEPGEGGVERFGRQELAAALRADAEPVLRLARARAPFVAELGHRPAFEPAQQFGALVVGSDRRAWKSSPLISSHLCVSRLPFSALYSIHHFFYLF